MTEKSLENLMQQECLLVVDDEVELLEIYDTLLSPEGFRVIQASNPKDAIECLKKEKIFLILTDFRMPGLNGAEFCAIVKKQNPQMPVVIISAFANEARASLDACRIGADDILSKPFNAKDIISVAKHFANRRLRQITNDIDEFESIV